MSYTNFQINVNSISDFENVSDFLTSAGYTPDSEWNDIHKHLIEHSEYTQCIFFAEVKHDIFILFWVHGDNDTSAHYTNLENYKHSIANYGKK